MTRAIGLLLLLFIGCHHEVAPAGPASAPSGPSLETCCAQCASASGRDPAGMDIGVKPCTAYHTTDFNGGPGVDDACAALFAKQKTLVKQCWK